MMNVEEQNKGEDYYAVLGLQKECTATELRTAYKKLAMKWHPDRCLALRNSAILEESKNKFQTIHQAYHVLSDDNKRFLYDLGFYNSNDDEDKNGMGAFLRQMGDMMGKPEPNPNKSFENLHELFIKTFQPNGCECSNMNNKWNSSKMDCSNMNNNGNSSKMDSDPINLNEPSTFEGPFGAFCMGVDDKLDAKKGKGRAHGGKCKKTKASSSSTENVATNEVGK